MHLKAKYLASEIKTFQADDGRTITYMRLYAWIPETFSFKQLKVQTDQMQAIEDAKLEFGDEFECTVEEGVSDKGAAFLRVIQW